MPRLCVECKEEAVGMVGANGLAHKSIWGDNSGNVHIRKCQVLENVHVATCELTEGRQSSANDMKWTFILRLVCHLEEGKIGLNLIKDFYVREVKYLNLYCRLHLNLCKICKLLSICLDFLSIILTLNSRS